MRGFLHACCDCGEVAISEYRIVHHRGKPAVEFRMYRDDAKTDQMRMNRDVQNRLMSVMREVFEGITKKLQSYTFKEQTVEDNEAPNQSGCNCDSCCARRKKTEIADGKMALEALNA